MRISVVIPVFNGGPDLEKCLAAISEYTVPVFECIIVDDASTDDMVNPAARRYGARVIRLDQQCGPAKARNRGVNEASGDIIFFTDADVLLHPDAIAQAVSAFQSDPGLDAVIGSYDDQPGHTSFISQYRNLFHHWVHQTSAFEATTFWTGCGAIRRDVFLKMGGFSPDYPRPCIEDIELGVRLHGAGHRIHLLKNMLGKHLKNWQFWNMIRTDIFQRGVPWMLLVLRDGQLGNNLNLSYKSRIATVLAGLLGVSLLAIGLSGHVAGILPTAALLLAAVISARLSKSRDRPGSADLFLLVLTVSAPLLCYWLNPDPLALIPLILSLAIVATHLSFYRYVVQKRNGAFAIGVIPMQVVFFFCCALSIPLAWIQHQFQKARSKKINAAASAED
jgi:hypothetical protein